MAQQGQQLLRGMPLSVLELSHLRVQIAFTHAFATKRPWRVMLVSDKRSYESTNFFYPLFRQPTFTTPFLDGETISHFSIRSSKLVSTRLSINPTLYC